MIAWLLLLAQLTAQQHLERGFSLAQQGRLKAAEAELREAVRQAPNNAQALAILGIALSQQNKIAEATPFLERSLKLDAGNANTRFNLALNQLRLNRRAPAIANLERIEASYPPAATLLATLREKDHALAEYRAGNYAAAQSRLEKLALKTPNDSDLLRLLAWCLHRRGESEGAQIMIQRAIEFASRDYDLYNNAAQILLEQHNTKAAQAAIERSLELAPGNPAALKLESAVNLERGNLKEALENLEQAAAKDAGDPEIIEQMGTVRRALFDTGGARKTLEAGLARFPNYARLHLAYGSLIRDSNEARAVAHFEKALALDPNLPAAHHQLGKILLDRDDPAAALPHLETAIRQSPSNPAFHLTAATAYRLLNRPADQARALAEYRRLTRD